MAGHGKEDQNISDRFKALEVDHKGVFKEYLEQDPPEISEFTFTNLFMWRHRYHPLWCIWGGCLLVILQPEEETPFGFQPVGAGDKAQALNDLTDALYHWTAEPRICRVSERFKDIHVDPLCYDVVPDRNNSDYVYRAEDLIRLPGKKYHRKKNHVNRFLKQNEFFYREMDMELVECFLDMQEAWCQMKACMENPDLLSEDFAVREALIWFEDLGYRGGAIQIHDRIEAFALGEILSPETAVIHVEKANPEFPGLYGVINQLFCKHAFSDMTYINREQDLGIEGLRKAKKSYHPHHMVNKYTLIPKSPA